MIDYDDAKKAVQWGIDAGLVKRATGRPATAPRGKAKPHEQPKPIRAFKFEKQPVEAPATPAVPTIDHEPKKECPVCLRKLIVTDGLIRAHRQLEDARGFGNGPLCTFSEAP